MKTMNKPKKKPLKKPEPSQSKSNREIPQSELRKFLSDKVAKEDWKKVRKIRAANVWSNRYRLNVWLEEYREGSMCPRIWIGYSYFLRYHEGIIIDETEEPKKKGRLS
jgi:hypothetical protein